MENSLKQMLFANGRERMTEAGIATEVNNSLLCPLCWEEVPFENLSIEHIVPSSVGGKSKTLTCRKCNNEHGASLDVHLTNYQRTKDAFKGHGTMPVEMNINGNRMVANLVWGEETKNFIVVGKASDHRAIAAIQDDFRANKVPEFAFTLNYGYAIDNFNRAVTRSTYLALFERFGYRYAQRDVIQALRLRVMDGALESPDLNLLVIGLGTAELLRDGDYLILRRNIEGTNCFLVIIRAQGNSTSYLGAFFPDDPISIKDFEMLMEQHMKKTDRKQVTVSAIDIVE